jgi:hypothetical protein
MLFTLVAWQQLWEQVSRSVILQTCLTIGLASHDPKVFEENPAMKAIQSEIAKLFVDPPELCGNTCAYLATGKAKELSGLYIDCRQDIERVCGVGRKTLEKHGLYNLKIDFLQGYCNEP